MIAPVIVGARILLRPLRIEDFKPLADLFTSERARFIGGPQPAKKVWRDFASDVGQWNLLGFGSWAIEERQTGACAGMTGLNFPVEFPERELGWVLFDGFENKGYAFEAAKLALGYAFDTLKFTTLVSYIDRDNARSIRLAEKLCGVPDPQAATPENDPCLVYRHLPGGRSKA
jgi:RimJ/RimL family protein N-acetyltransferase